MPVKRVANPGDDESLAPFAIPQPCMCWHSWGTFPDVFDVRASGDLDDQATQMIARGEALSAAGKALREVAASERARKR